MSATAREPRLCALLIGIDYYLPSRSIAVPSYPSLAGAVADVDRVEEFLRRSVGLRGSYIRRLTSSLGLDGGVEESEVDRPSYENIVLGLEWLRESSSPGDQVLIHYSGHGGRASTLVPGLKGSRGLDECLVPFDIARPEARYVRDIEMAFWLRKMVEAGRFITLVLDCCHSGGVTRSHSGNVGAIARGIDRVDRSRRFESSAFAPLEDLTQAWELRRGGHLRTLSVERGWLPQPYGYALLAACRPQEVAFEATFDGRRGGALTYWLLETLSETFRLSYRQIYDRLVGRIRTQFPSQTPQLEGEAERRIFEHDVRPSLYGVNVLSVHQGQGEDSVCIAAGLVHGLPHKARLEVFPDCLHGPGGDEERLAILEITQLGATVSVARICDQASPERALRPGDQAFVMTLGDLPGRRRAWWLEPGHLECSKIGFAASAKRRFYAALEDDRSGLLEAGSPGEGKDGFEVTLTEQGAYEIRDARGVVLTNRLPQMSGGQRKAAAHLVEGLVHLAKFDRVRQLKNADGTSPLRCCLALRLSGIPKVIEQDESYRKRASPNGVGLPTVRVGDSFMLTITNQSLRVLNVVALNLQPDWAIDQLYPSVERGSFEPVDPESEVRISLRAHLPSSYDHGIDIIKVFATLGPISLQCLELPSLLGRRSAGERRPASSNSERPAASRPTLLDGLRGSGSSALNLLDADWAVGQVEVRVLRG